MISDSARVTWFMNVPDSWFYPAVFFTLVLLNELLVLKVVNTPTWFTRVLRGHIHQSVQLDLFIHLNTPSNPIYTIIHEWIFSNFSLKPCACIIRPFHLAADLPNPTWRTLPVCRSAWCWLTACSGVWCEAFHSTGSSNPTTWRADAFRIIIQHMGAQLNRKTGNASKAVLC